MSSANLTALAGFATLFLMMLLRVPIGIAMALVGVGGFAAIAGWGPALNLLATSPVRTATDINLSLIPMFVLMGVLATASGMSKELFRAGHAWLGRFKGGLALATIGACGGFAAICGSSVATAATMSNIALPEMRRFGYPDDLATGVIAAGGTLGILIPPSVVLAVYAFITEQDVGRLFIAGVVPGLLALAMYMATVRFAYGRRLPAGETIPWRERRASLRGIWAVLLLFVLIIGGIYQGIVTPTEAAAAGAFLTGLIGVLRRRLDAAQILACLAEALRTTVAIFTILIGALLFGYFLAITQTPQKITAFLVALDLGSYGTLALILAFFVLLGCVLDAMAMVILLVPIVFPVIQTLGFDPIWFGVIVVMTVELGLITPPVGMNVFVINSIVPDTSLIGIFRGVAPFVLTDLVRLALLVAFPWLVLFLPTTMGRDAMLDLKPLCDLEIRLGTPLELGVSLRGRRRVIPITGGTVLGERLRGEVLPGGADWQTVYEDGTAQLEARYTLRLDDGALIDVTNFGYRHGPPEILAALARGAAVDPQSYTMRTTPRFETGAARHAWLNHTLFVATGARLPEAVRLSVFEVL